MQVGREIVARSQEHPNRKFKLMKKVGEGAQGFVYFAIAFFWGSNSNKEYALKFQRYQAVKEQEYNFIKLVMDYQNSNYEESFPSNMIRILDIFEYTNYLVTVMEKGEQDLYNYLGQNRQKITNKEKSKICLDVVMPIYFLHANGFVHREIKPENYIKVGDKFKLIDFGLVRKIDRMADFNMTKDVGTMLFSAPEMIDNISNYTDKVDVWSLGCLFYEIFNQDSLFEGQNFEQVRQSIINHRDKPKVVNDKIDKLTCDLPIKNLMKQMLQYDQNKRFNTQQVQEQLLNILPIYQKLQESQSPTQPTLPSTQPQVQPPTQSQPQIDEKILNEKLLNIEKMFNQKLEEQKQQIRQENEKQLQILEDTIKKQQTQIKEYQKKQEDFQSSLRQEILTESSKLVDTGKDQQNQLLPNQILDIKQQSEQYQNQQSQYNSYCNQQIQGFQEFYKQSLTNQQGLYQELQQMKEDQTNVDAIKKLQQEIQKINSKLAEEIENQNTEFKDQISKLNLETQKQQITSLEEKYKQIEVDMDNMRKLKIESKLSDLWETIKKQSNSTLEQQNKIKLESNKLNQTISNHQQKLSELEVIQQQILQSLKIKDNTIEKEKAQNLQQINIFVQELFEEIKKQFNQDFCLLEQKIEKKVNYSEIQEFKDAIIEINKQMKQFQSEFISYQIQPKSTFEINNQEFLQFKLDKVQQDYQICQQKLQNQQSLISTQYQQIQEFQNLQEEREKKLQEQVEQIQKLSLEITQFQEQQQKIIQEKNLVILDLYTSNKEIHKLKQENQVLQQQLDNIKSK